MKIETWKLKIEKSKLDTRGTGTIKSESWGLILVLKCELR
jgi:hypothetical protein